MKKNFLNYLVKACAAYEYSMGWDVAYFLSVMHKTAD